MIHPLIANKYSPVLTVLLPFSNFGSTQRGCLTSKFQRVIFSLKGVFTSILFRQTSYCTQKFIEHCEEYLNFQSPKAANISQNIGKIESNTACLMFLLLRCSYITITMTCFGPFIGHLQVEHCQLYGLDCVWNVMAHAQKPDFVFRRNGWVHLNRQGPQFSRLLAAEVCASAVVMLDTPRFEVVKGTGYPLHLPVSPSIPLPGVAVCHHISTGLYLTKEIVQPGDGPWKGRYMLR